MAIQVLPTARTSNRRCPYHRLVTELFLGAARLADYRGAPLPRACVERLVDDGRFLAAVAATRRPHAAESGDADDGRLHILSGYGTGRRRTRRHLFGPAGRVLRNAGWAALGRRVDAVGDRVVGLRRCRTSAGDAGDAPTASAIFRRQD